MITMILSVISCIACVSTVLLLRHNSFNNQVDNLKKLRNVCSKDDDLSDLKQTVDSILNNLPDKS